jgi:hypothetical protein
MAMNSNILGMAIAKVLMDKSTVLPTPGMITNIQQFWKDVSAEVVGHIQDNAEVPAGISVVTSGGPTSQTGATTAVGTVK